MNREEREKLTSDIASALERAEFFVKEARDNLSAGKTYESWGLIETIKGELEDADNWFYVMATSDESDD